MRQAYDMGLVTRDEIAMKLFAHSAHLDELYEDISTQKS